MFTIVERLVSAVNNRACKLYTAIIYLGEVISLTTYLFDLISKRTKITLCVQIVPFIQIDGDINKWFALCKCQYVSSKNVLYVNEIPFYSQLNILHY